ncbi:KH domain-containing protein [Candidatus Dependentiae bacterium]|nr:MAG: KH domain-containing protein [Candidatus Dependentiae bacterium]
MTKELVEYVVKQLVNKPDAASVSVSKTDDKTLIEITVDELDRGKVIGRSGQTIKALRMLVSAVVADDKKITVDLAK